MRKMTTLNAGQLLALAKSVVPPLQYTKHKGQAGRVAVIGGCKEYTGAPYFAAISALKAGADLSHVFCTEGASPVIKAYSPELIVHPVLDWTNSVGEILQWLPRFHSIVVGPGLGREEQILNSTSAVIEKAKEKNIPIVIDADGLFLVTQNPAIIKGYTNAVLTPNAAEFGRLYKKVFNTDPNSEEPVDSVKQLCRELGSVTIVHKGAHDIISDGDKVLMYFNPGSPRRCGGQGDLLSGTMGLFAAWAKFAQDESPSESISTYPYGMQAAYLACALTRECARRAFQLNGRSMTTTDMIAQIHASFEDLFSEPQSVS
ncbi:ATP-dependent (S)-NAD(P)H-hydrate dehydratase [Elysia marginata]|uniref:ATP-dependent (S)-NAD(P)H-hydrate dehydratase n=1 Tax=Elysia marginata TaxID=1093978 RepID=A0AAV4FMN4_9GAST|nr:ATP-dependent (S)-NAD(P)H-hydrate dehydratase [Elysia marginata]